MRQIPNTPPAAATPRQRSAPAAAPVPDTSPDAGTSSKKQKGRRKTKGGETGVPSKFLRITYLLPRDRIKRLEWLMERSNAATKVDLLRMALNHYERHVIREQAELEDQRKRAGVPDIGVDL